MNEKEDAFNKIKKVVDKGNLDISDNEIIELVDDLSKTRGERAGDSLRSVLHRIEFEKGSVIEGVKSNGETIRGNRSKHLECVCYDIENEKWIIGKPLLNENHIPEWVIEEILNKNTTE